MTDLQARVSTQQRCCFETAGGYGEIALRSETIDLYEAKVRIMSLADLIRSKAAAGRAKDLVDLEPPGAPSPLGHKGRIIAHALLEVRRLRGRPTHAVLDI